MPVKVEIDMVKCNGFIEVIFIVDINIYGNNHVPLNCKWMHHLYDYNNQFIC